jgi:hypothetical protein
VYVAGIAKQIVYASQYIIQLKMAEWALATA